MGMTEDDKRNCCLLEIQETEAKYYRTLEDIEKVGVAAGATQDPCLLGDAVTEQGLRAAVTEAGLRGPLGFAPSTKKEVALTFPLPSALCPHTGCGLHSGQFPRQPPPLALVPPLTLWPQLGPWTVPELVSEAPSSLNWASLQLLLLNALS